MSDLTRRYWFDEWIAQGFPASVRVGEGRENAERFARSYLSSSDPLSHKAKMAWKQQRGEGSIPSVETYGDAARAYLHERELEQSRLETPPKPPDIEAWKYGPRPPDA